MSWEAYVDNILAHGKGNISKAVIIGLDGSIWTPSTKSTIMNVSVTEAATIGSIMKSKDITGFKEKGIVLEGTKYMFLRDMEDDGRIVTGKKVKIGNIIMQSTKQAVLIAQTPEGKAVGDSNVAVDTVAKYLESSNF